MIIPQRLSAISFVQAENGGGGNRTRVRPSTNLPIQAKDGYYFAGLTDGEGCFSMRDMNAGTTISCQFVIKMRLDDMLLLESLREAVGGLGKLYIQREVRDNRKPQVRWSIYTKADCVRLVHVFDEFPLRSKKADDYHVWRKAVLAWSEMPRTGGDWSELKLLKEDLVEGRSFPPELDRWFASVEHGEGA